MELQPVTEYATETVPSVLRAFVVISEIDLPSVSLSSLSASRRKTASWGESRGYGCGCK